MSTCGNCGKSVTARDVTCPHCGVLLAAYASPTGSGAAGTYEEPAPPPPTEIPSVDMDVKPPSEKDVVTDPTQVAEEPISTAPRPLFDTYLTVEEIAKAAESDHADDVVTISSKKIATKKVEFEVPDYAKPPASADPIPTIDDEDFDASIPLITHDDSLSDEESVEAEDAPNPKAQPANESWLYNEPTKTLAPKPVVPDETKPKAQSESRAPSGPVGTTDEYLRKLHQEAGYTPKTSAISKPVEERRISPAERRKNREKSQGIMGRRATTEASAESKSTKMGCTTMYVMVLGVFWFSTIVAMMSGNFSPVLIFMTVVATWAYSPLRKFLNGT